MVGSLVVIGDKDGAVVTELRAPLGAIPTYDVGTGDGTSRQYWQEQIQITSTGDQTIHTVESGKRFSVQTIVLEVQQAGTAMRLKSGANQTLSGVIRLGANTPLSVMHANESPLKGKYINDNFVINTSGDYVIPYVTGWVTGYDEAV